ncbi:MAG TPA: hypothetical protein VM370_07035 [Candidatus Thermoplasmatota archaeon]|nr:hypothetical protein [Candidatus Thermoplasmatota archaeon]
MRGIAWIGIVLCATTVLTAVPLASADPLIEFTKCFVDQTEPFVLRACIVTWDQPQEICFDGQLGVRIIARCVDNPDFPPELP